MPPRVRSILQSVADEHGIEVADLMGRCHGRWAAVPRFAAMARLRAVQGANGKPQFSTTKIGGYLGGRDHSSVVAGLKRAAAIFGPPSMYPGAIQDPEDTRL